MKIYCVELEENNTGVIAWSTAWHNTAEGAIVEGINSRYKLSREECEQLLTTATIVIDIEGIISQSECGVCGCLYDDREEHKCSYNIDVDEYSVHWSGK